MSLQRVQVCPSMFAFRLPPVSFRSGSQPIKKLKVEADGPYISFGLCFSAWEELSDDIDREFILDGIKNGFDLIDKDANPTPVACF